MAGIMRAASDAALTLKAGCGIGYDFTTLRPRGAHVSGAGATTSGPLSFMDVFDAICRTVSSAGGRRGAQLACIKLSRSEEGSEGKEWVRSCRCRWSQLNIKKNKKITENNINNNY